MKLKTELDATLKMVREIGDLALKSFGRAKFIDVKDDKSFVTEIDKECETLIRNTLLKHFPKDGFMGEETDCWEGSSGRRWIVDPIDGTLPYIKGIPTFSNLIGLEEADKIVLGVIHLPAMGVTCWATKGGGAFCNGERISVSQVSKLKQSVGSAAGITRYAEAQDGKNLLRLMRDCYYQYGFMDAYTYCCIAQGKIDLCVNLMDKAWDRAPAVCIIEEAGGRFSTLNGESDVCGQGTVLTNGHLHEAVLSYFTV